MKKSDYTSEKLNVSGYFYSENDAKNQPLQQALSEAQKQTLSQRGKQYRFDVFGKRFYRHLQ